MSRNLFSKDILIVAGIILLCFVTRLPQLTSNNLVLDEDECVVGLMAKHMYEGRDMPLYFYGQHYGFSVIETSTICVFYFFFGESDHSVKLAMLSLWTLGILLFYKTIKQINKGNEWLPLLITLVFIFSPAWAAWSMKARGGYLSSFFLSFLLIYILFHKNSKKTITLFIIGLLLVLIWQCQVLWIPGLVPIVAYKIYEQKSVRHFISLVCGIALGVILFMTIKQPEPEVFEPISLAIKSRWLAHTPELLFSHFTGFYYLWFTYTPPVACAIFAYLFIAILLLLAGAAIYCLLKKRKEYLLFIIAVAAVYCSLLFPVFIRGNNARYMLPLTGFILLSAFLFAERLKRSRLFVGGSFLLIGIGALCLYNFKDYQFNPTTRGELMDEINLLEKEGLSYDFSTSIPLEWQIMFYSKEKIICRSIMDPDRYEYYVKKVNSEYERSANQSAIIGYGMDSVKQTPKGYFIICHPDKETIARMGFKL